MLTLVLWHSLYVWKSSQKIHGVSQEKYHTWRIIWISWKIAEQLMKRMDENCFLKDSFYYQLPSHPALPPPTWGLLPPKDAGTSVDAGGASGPFPPNRPVRATPSPKRMLRAHAQHQWTLGAHQTPLPQETGTSNPFPLTPTSLYKGITDRAHS